ncbi:MAG: NFACT family protein [Selenomonadaceae bacterium]|nr:NFACT family protein [Selenomonadaceae bacterium]
MGLEGFSMSALARELNQALEGGRIDKINQPTKTAVILGVRQPGKNLWLYISVNSQNPGLYLLDTPRENPPEPPVFCMVLRKQLETGRIAGLRQHGLDRLLMLDIDTLAAGGKIVTKTLVLELMGKYSNIILTEDGRIIDALRKIGQGSSRVRTVLPGQAYELPPGQDKLNLFTDSSGEITTRIAGHSGEKLAKAVLATCLGFGPVTAKEAVHRAGLSPEIRVDKLTDANWQALRQSLTTMADLCRREDEEAIPTLVTDEHGKILAMSAFPLKHLTDKKVHSFAALSPMLRQADEWLGSYTPPDKERLRKLVRNEIKRAATKLAKIREELMAAENAARYKVYGDNLMTYQYQLTDHADEAVTVADIYSETGETITIPLERKMTVIQNMQACYKKYDKLKRAQSRLQEQIELGEAELRYLESIDTSLSASETLAEINEIHDELASGGYLKEKTKRKKGDKPAVPFKFQAADGAEILVGKNNSQNDRLTFKVAAPHDLWLHAKDIPGSHVILRTEGQDPTPETLLFAAELAAYFSKAQGSSNVPVDYTRCRYVKKPSGAKPGFVIFTNQRTLYVTPKAEYRSD